MAAATNQLHNGLIEVVATPGVTTEGPVKLVNVPASPTALTAPAATAATNSSPYGYSQAQADAIKTAVIAIVAILQAAALAS